MRIPRPYKCDWCDYHEPDGTCSCTFQCSACGKEYKSGLHSADDCVNNLKIKLSRVEAQNRKLRDALENIIEMNLQLAKEKYGDATEGETWACVRVAKEALNVTEPQAEGASSAKEGA